MKGSNILLLLALTFCLVDQSFGVVSFLQSDFLQITMQKDIDSWLGFFSHENLVDKMARNGLLLEIGRAGKWI